MSIASAKFPLDDVFPILDGESFDRLNDSTYTFNLKDEESINKSVKNLCLLESLNNVTQSFKNFLITGIWALV